MIAYHLRIAGVVLEAFECRVPVITHGCLSTKCLWIVIVLLMWMMQQILSKRWRNTIAELV